ncbi:hypothetical protein ACIPPM_13650 [Streptomyces sp. NPDC090119]|uniref:hypothetical protein n=1 Tax=Streptomyces sp. NPDC090119 TaxID=3365951 RepID=UPI00380FA62C
MITTDPVGDWTWEILPEAAEEEIHPSRAAAAAVSMLRVLTETGLAAGEAEVDEYVRSADEAASVVGVCCECPGRWTDSGAEHQAEGLFRVQAEVWGRRLLSVTLETFGDVWLTVDTRGREQLALHAENAPRLRRALAEISRSLGRAPVPGDENPYATPTEEGFEDVRVHGPAYDDAWGTFEVAARSRRLRASLPPSVDEYRETTEHPVHHLTVRDDEDRVLGYLWADGVENAAGFEPRTAAGERAFQAGRGWLLKLREAHRLGLPAADVLPWLAGEPLPRGVGRLADLRPRVSPSLDALEELSGS